MGEKLTALVETVWRVRLWWARWFGPQEVILPRGVTKIPGPIVLRGRVVLRGGDWPPAAGDGVTDDTDAFQGASDAAGRANHRGAS